MKRSQSEEEEESEEKEGKKKKKEEIFEEVPADNLDEESKTKVGWEVMFSHVKVLALGSMLVNHKKSKQDLLDEAYNRFAFNDTENLPDWFVDDERRHNKPQLPITKQVRLF